MVWLKSEYAIATKEATMIANPITTIAQYGKGWQVVGGMDSNFEEGHTEDGQRLPPKSPTTRITIPRTSPMTETSLILELLNSTDSPSGRMTP